MIKAAEKVFRKYFPKKFPHRKLYRSKVQHKRGIEIGGPSAIFDSTGILPLYNSVESLDGCNFSNHTIWEGEISEGKNYHAGNKSGRQFIAEATMLSMIKNESYDFVLSCHNLEHVANPILALREWKRISVKNGFLVLILPHKDKTFDHRRPVTTIDHLKEDFQAGVDEQDETHIPEILKLHDCLMEQPVVTLEELKERLTNNFQNRCAHHHVFDARLTVEMLDFAGFQLLDLSVMYHNIIVLAQAVTDKPDNGSFLSPEHKAYSDSRYPSDFSYSQLRYKN